ncbi:hypothetical protein [Cronobacter sakazakii]|uniref:hypothetical protein n=1 Tax=Cronobacter sakazakii TaxID=28141 RepID=UPI003F690423
MRGDGMKGSIKSHKSAIAVLLALALSGQSSWAAQNSAAVQGNDFLSSIQQIEVKQIDFPAPTHRQQTPSASRAQINDLQQEIARLKKQLKAAEQEKKSLSAPGDLQAQNTQLLKDNSALVKENDRLSRSLQNAQREQGATSTQQAARIEALEQKTAELQASLASKTEELAQLKKSSNSQAASESALQKQIARLETEKAAIAERNTKDTARFNHDMQALRNELNKRADELVALKNAGDKRAQSQSALEKQLAQLEKEKTALTAQSAQSIDAANKKAQALQSQQQQAAQIAAAKEALTQQLATAQADIATLKQSLADKENRLQQSDKALLALKEEAQSAKALTTASATSQQKTQAELEALKHANEELNAKLASLSAENTAQKAQAEKEKAELLAQAEKLKADAATQAQTVAATKSEAEVSAAALKDKANKQSYANGVMFSRLVQKSMDQMADLGIKTNLPILLAGIKDGLAQKVAVEPKTLLSLHESMLKELSSREEKKYQAGIDQLEKATAKKKLLKRNKSLFFVQAKAGKKAIAPGETVNVTFKEATYEGRVINNNANVPVTYDENLPYIFQQALELGKRGGVMEVYCFAGDLYNPDTMPPDLFNYSLMKLTVTISGGK